MHSEKLANNPLRTRADLADAMQELWRPIRALLERDGAALSLGANSATYGAPTSMVEAFARPLWGVAAHVAGGGTFADGALIRQALAEGVDPAHPRYWGQLGEHDQRAVEMGSLAASLWLAPGLLWDPLPERTRTHLVAWLRQINDHALWDNNWLFFRVLVNGALRAVGAAADETRMRTDLARLSSFYRDKGWYSDGTTSHFDYYIPMAMHLYGLFYAGLAGSRAPHAEDFLERARLFAPQFAAWFAPEGSALPLGRSLAYRFAQGAFWGGLAFAGVEALPWSVIKGLHLRHLRWWLRQPIFSENGLLTVGYAYPNQIMAEGYNSPASPYWATKAFLPLALPAAHPFWTADEGRCAVPEIVTSPARAGLVICRDESRGHVFALSNNPLHPAGHRHTAQKYGKFVYSTAFAFDVPVGGNAPRHGTSDSMLLVSVDGRDWRAREEFAAVSAAAHTLHCRWHPWPDIEVETWLAPALPGHVRIHRIRSPRLVHVCEGGFPIAQTPTLHRATAPSQAAVDNGTEYSAIWELAGARQPRIIAPEPNTNLLHPRTVVPVLESALAPGESWLFTAVAGLPGAAQKSFARAWRKELRADTSGTPGIRRGETLLLRCHRREDTAKLPVRVATRPREVLPRLRAAMRRIRGKS